MTDAPRRSTIVPRIRAALARAIVAVWLRTGSRIAGRLFHYDLIFRTGTFAALRWAGHPIWQNPVDLWTIQETIFEIRPSLLIETGTNRGGSALFYAHLLDIVGEGKVITIDVERLIDVSHPRIEFIEGSSTDADVIARVRALAEEAEGHVMVILDGDHSYEHVLRELELYGPLVTRGSFLLSQDGIIDQMRIYRRLRPGPLVANEEYLADHPEFEYDAERNERYALTQHPRGWMRKVR